MSEENEIESAQQSFAPKWFAPIKSLFSYFTNVTFPKFTFLKVILSLFLLMLFFYPIWIKESVEKSEIIKKFDEILLAVSSKFQTIKYGGLEIQSQSISKVEVAKNLASTIDVTKIKDETIKKEVEQVFSLIKETDKTIKIDIIKQETPSITNSIGWIYLGKTDNKTKITTATTNIPNINQIPKDTLFEITDNAYLREESPCPRSNGKIITVLEKAKQIKALSDAQFCQIENTEEFGVWLKVERQ